MVSARDAGPVWAYALRVAAADVPAALPALVRGLDGGDRLSVPDATSRDPEALLTVQRTRAGFTLQRGGHGWSADAAAADLAGALAAVAGAAVPGAAERWLLVYLERPKLAPGPPGA